jgi:hypothetical protein
MKMWLADGALTIPPTFLNARRSRSLAGLLAHYSRDGWATDGQEA